MEQRRGPMDKNRIRGIRCRASGHVIAKSISINATGCKSGGCAPKEVELTSGDLPFVPETGMRAKRFVLAGRQKSAEDVVGAKALKARTVRRKPVHWSGE